MDKRIIALCVASSVLFSACGGSSSRPKDGYDAFVKKQQEYYISIGGTKDSFKGKGAYYAWIQGDGTLEAGTLVDTVWYKISYAINTGTKESNFTTFAVLTKGSTIPVELDSAEGNTSIGYAVSLIRDGSLKGEVSYIGY